ncbi:MAG: acyl-CoA dehydrogenase family protein [Candidatus Omnitrophica bacterium]|nr:acyl-CoA dehydrogenase family protein [Candidatus Omnitrophota bacterium]
MSLFDKNISQEKKASLEFAEEQRQEEWHHPSFALQLFHGHPDWDLIHPFPEQSLEEKAEGDAFINRLHDFLLHELDPDEVDRTGTIPERVMEGLAELGAFAIKVPKEYGGLGLSQVNYNRAMEMVASYCGSTAVLLSAHQSIGVPQPLKLFGTEEQKKKYFPMFASGVVSAFALTEPNVGSDPRSMSTRAEPVDDGQNFIINGEKLWCTNGLIAGVIVVMAVTPPKIVNGKERKQITAFIVETNTPGFEILHRCKFMGLNGIQNGLIRFHNVKVPKENIIGQEGDGLKLALTTLNTGRLTLPAASVGVSRWCLHVARQWSQKRVQWGSPVGEHESVALKLADMANHTYSMEAMTWLVSAMADDKKNDIRLEAAIAKYFSTYHTWRIVDETLQIRGGQGYECASSLKARGEDFWPVERVLRDVRINLIIEGTTEIMHLFIAREALDPHLSRAKPILSSRTPLSVKMKTVLKMVKFYIPWIIRLYLPKGPDVLDEGIHPKIMEYMGDVQRLSRRLAREVIGKMGRYQQKLESKQSALNRIVDIGTELFAMASVCSYTIYMLKKRPECRHTLKLAEGFCEMSKRRIARLFQECRSNKDNLQLSIAKAIMEDELLWMEEEIVK